MKKIVFYVFAALVCIGLWTPNAFAQTSTEKVVWFIHGSGDNVVEIPLVVEKDRFGHEIRSLGQREDRHVQEKEAPEL